MSGLRRTRPRVVTLVASALVVGSCLVAALSQAREWVGPAGSANAHLVWPIVALLAAFLAIPWFILVRQARGLGARGRRATLLALAGYVAAGLVLGGGLVARWVRRSEFVPSWVVLSAGVGVAMVGVIMTAGRRRGAPAAVPRRRRVRVAWLWAGAALLAGGAPLLAWFAGRDPTPPPPAVRKPAGFHGWPEVEPVGPFAQLLSEPGAADQAPARDTERPGRQYSGADRSCSSRSVVGWFWVRGADRWRQAVVLRTPFRVEGQVASASAEPLRLFVALCADAFAKRDAPVQARVVAREDTGETVAECRRDLPVPEPQANEFGPWEVLELDLAKAARDTVQVALEAHVQAPDEGWDPPFLALATEPPEGAQVVSRSSGPNCVIILVDALRTDRLHCYGYPPETSPRIDQLASQGTLFEDVVSASSWTVPSVASLFTGTHVATHGVSLFQVSTHLPLPTLAEHFQKAGVRTAAVSANSLVTPRGGFGSGFDEFFAGNDWEKARPRAEWVTDHAIDCLRRFDGRRFFLYLHYMDVHSPYDPPPGWNTFGGDDHARYLGEIRYCDSEIGRLLDELEALGRGRDTLVVFLADHGEAFGERGYYEHGYTVHREEVQVPLILRWPDVIPAGARVGARVASIDVHATIAELMGLPRLRHVEGESLLPLLRLDKPRPDRTVFSDLSVAIRQPSCPPQICIYQGDNKLILFNEGGQRLLYNVRVDREERWDLAPAEPALAASMERRIRAFIKQREGRESSARSLTHTEVQLLQTLGYLTPTSGPATRRAVPPPGRADPRVGAER